MFSVITNIYNKKTKGPTLMELFTATGKLKTFFYNERRSMCAPWVTRHTSMRYSSSYHTRVNMGASMFLCIHSHRLAAEMWTTMKTNFLGKKCLSCSFHLYRFRKYMLYGFPIINFCNPGVHYEMPCGARRGAEVEALRYKPEGRGIDSRWCQWNFSLGSTQPLTEMSTRNISCGYRRPVRKLTTLPPACANCLKIWEPQPPGTLRACQGL
jgi:hypothetical protein